MSHAYSAPLKGDAPSGSDLLSEVALPAAAILESALDHNIRWMQHFAEAHGAVLAPHGKTTMTPAIFQRQLAAGAWGITLATAHQCAAAFEHGVTRLLMANQLVGDANMAIVAALIERGADYYCTVDSHDNVHALGAYFSARGLCVQVLAELGVPGGRCGVRDDDALAALLDTIAATPGVRLRGIEGYEGLVQGADPIAAVRAYAARLVAAVERLPADAGSDAPIVTASGSRWFDLIAEAFSQAELGGRYLAVLRPGCYVTHDHRLYHVAMQEVKQRHPALEGELLPALRVFARVQSLPEPGLAVVALGRRDIAYDPDLPIPLELHRPGLPARALDGCSTQAIMDQHCMLRLPAGLELAIGDVLSFGASHPCLTFDKWQRLLLVDDALQVRTAMATAF